MRVHRSIAISWAFERAKVSLELSRPLKRPRTGRSIKAFGSFLDSRNFRKSMTLAAVSSGNSAAFCCNSSILLIVVKRSRGFRAVKLGRRRGVTAKFKLGV